MPRPTKGQRIPGSGRAKGTPNKITADVRAAIAQLVQGNVARCQEWLDAVADESPEKALDLFLRLIEYHIPKLARAEVDVRHAETIEAELMRLEEEDRISRPSLPPRA